MLEDASVEVVKTAKHFVVQPYGHLRTGIGVAIEPCELLPVDADNLALAELVLRCLDHSARAPVVTKPGAGRRAFLKAMGCRSWKSWRRRRIRAMVSVHTEPTKYVILVWMPDGPGYSDAPCRARKIPSSAPLERVGAAIKQAIKKSEGFHGYW